MSHELVSIEPSRLLAVRAVRVRVIEQVFQLLDPSLWKKNRRVRERDKRREISLEQFSNHRDLAMRNTKNNSFKRRKEKERENARLSPTTTTTILTMNFFFTCIFSHPFFRWTTSLFASGIFLSFSSSSRVFFFKSLSSLKSLKSLKTQVSSFFLSFFFSFSTSSLYADAKTERERERERWNRRTRSNLLLLLLLLPLFVLLLHHLGTSVRSEKKKRRREKDDDSR